MLFNSLEFALFLPLVFFLYWFVTNKNLTAQNFLLLVASYFFYGWWDWRFLSLLFISSVIDYFAGYFLDKTGHPVKRLLLLILSLSTNLGLLGFFKYYNFFVDSLVTAMASAGVTLNTRSLNVILPVGISFYTFQTMSYTIDLYRKKIASTKDFIAFLTFVSFFPQLVAGPIERAANLLPQCLRKRVFDYGKAKDGMRQIIWGLFKKIVIADTCAGQVDLIFSNSTTMQSSDLWLGAFYFAFQIYGDFSGYSDIAIGTARLFGFELMRNFALPYFSRDIAEFWRRWHISLSTWFKDYVYISLGGSYGGKWKWIRNIIITFTISGFWHGANWTFIAWGFLNGLYYLPLLLSNRQKQHTGIVAENRFFPSLHELFQIVLTFLMTLIAWIFFRAENIRHAIQYITALFSRTLFQLPSADLIPLYLVIFLVVVEWLQRKKQFALQIHDLPFTVRWICYYAVALMVLGFYGGEKTFIYFQF